MKIDNMIIDIQKLKKELEEVEGNWDGDNPGIAEDNARNAGEALEHLGELVELLEELGYDTK